MSRKKNQTSVSAMPKAAEVGSRREEMLTKDDILEKRLIDGLQKFDDMYMASEPDVMSLQQALEEHKQVERRKLKRELVLFLAMGMVIIAASIALYMNLPASLLAVQGTVLLVPLLALLGALTRKTDRRGKRVDRR
ncbi:YxlC family protein [Gorillibacterium massiliense]|uniref:YxlC family protein n=1 Tax=Gorillibacterium massiliense TaxID=1280390 RepID=UPI0006936B57|nr:YxlC family protein [Gorillibacterium massiliense]